MDTLLSVTLREGGAQGARYGLRILSASCARDASVHVNPAAARRARQRGRQNQSRTAPGITAELTDDRFRAGAGLLHPRAPHCTRNPSR